jgi:hypothetical protein
MAKHWATIVYTYGYCIHIPLLCVHVQFYGYKGSLQGALLPRQLYMHAK